MLPKVVVADADAPMLRSFRQGGSRVRWGFELDRFVEEVNDELHVGHAWVGHAHLSGSDVPIGIFVGGWPVEEPCCAGTAAPAEDSAGDPGRRERMWECARCGEIVPPQVWTMVPLVVGHAVATRTVEVPPTSAVAKSADLAVRHLMVSRQESAVEACRRIGTELLTAKRTPVLPVGPVHLQLGPARPRRHDYDLGEPVVVVEHDQRGDGHGQLEVGCWGVDLDEWMPPSRRFAAMWTPATRITLGAADALRLLGPDTEARVRAAAAEGTLTEEQLRDTWSRGGDDSPGYEIGAPPAWLFDTAAVAAIKRRAGRRRSVGIGR